jgi:hypothetical protein
MNDMPRTYSAADHVVNTLTTAPPQRVVGGGSDNVWKSSGGECVGESDQKCLAYKRCDCDEHCGRYFSRRRAASS